MIEYLIPFGLGVILNEFIRYTYFPCLGCLWRTMKVERTNGVKERLICMDKFYIATHHILRKKINSSEEIDWFMDYFPEDFTYEDRQYYLGLLKEILVLREQK